MTKPKYTLILKDNETGETILESDVEKTSLKYSQKRLVHESIIKFAIKAEGFLAPEEKESKPSWWNTSYED